jgi:hypothetical protein
MTYDTQTIRDAAFSIMENLDNPASRTSSGQQWLVELKDGTKANLKTAAKGTLMVKTKAPENDADIVGFNADVSHILAAVSLPGETTVTAYLIPLKVVESAFRRNNMEWCAKGRKQGTTWALHFEHVEKDYFGWDMATVWSEYAVGSIELPAADKVFADKDLNRSLTIAEAKKGLSLTFGVDEGAIEITIRG